MNSFGYFIGCPKLDNCFYKGVATLSAWPLENENDSISLALTQESKDRWFYYQDVLIWLVPDIDYIFRYFSHCAAKGLSCEIYYLSSKNSPVSTIPISSRMCLGYDCMGTIEMSYLLEDDAFALFKKEFQKAHILPNKYGLLRSFSDGYKYLKIRESAIGQGLNLEDAWPAQVLKVEQITI